MSSWETKQPEDPKSSAMAIKDTLSVSSAPQLSAPMLRPLAQIHADLGDHVNALTEPLPGAADIGAARSGAPNSGEGNMALPPIANRSNK